MQRQSLVLSVTEAGLLLGLSRASAYKGVHSGQIPSIRVGARLLIPTAAIIKLLESASGRNPDA